MKTQLVSFAISAMLLSTAIVPVPVKPDTKGTNAEQLAAPGFSFFRTHRQGKAISASWGVSSNAGVAGFVLQKTYEDPTDPYAVWEDVSSVACDGSRSYKATDNNVFPGSITYRVSALSAGGSSVESATSTARIVSH